MKSSLYASLATILICSDFMAALPQLTKITNATESNVTVSTQRTFKSYGQAVIELLQNWENHTAYFVLSKRNQICAHIWKEIAAKKSLQSKFIIFDDSQLNSNILQYINNTWKYTIITDVHGSQLEYLLKLANDMKLHSWSFIILGDRVPVKEFKPYRYALPPVICTQFEFEQNQMLRNGNKSITFFDYHFDTMRNQPILIPFASWKNGVLRRRKMTASKKAVGIFNGRTLGISFINSEPLAGYGPNDTADTYAAHMLQDLNEYFGNRVVVEHAIKSDTTNWVALSGIVNYGSVDVDILSTTIPTMGEFCIGFAFRKVPVSPTADIFVDPFPKDIWLILIFLILLGHIFLKFQVWLQMVCRQSVRRVGIQEWLFLDVDEDLRLARSLGISMVSVKLIVLLVIVISFTFSMIYSTKFASALTNIRDIDIPYHSVAEFCEKWQGSSVCIVSLNAMQPIYKNKFTSKGNSSTGEDLFYELVMVKHPEKFGNDWDTESSMHFLHGLEQKICFIDFVDTLQYFFQRRCNYGLLRDTILCMDFAPLAFVYFFPFVELYQNALLRFKETGIAKRLRLQFRMEYKDCKSDSFLKPIQMSFAQYILAICFIGWLVALLVLIVELAVYRKQNRN